MGKYTVHARIRMEIEVEAESENEARSIAQDEIDEIEHYVADVDVISVRAE